MLLHPEYKDDSKTTFLHTREHTFLELQYDKYKPDFLFYHIFQNLRFQNTPNNEDYFLTHIYNFSNQKI